MSTIQPRFAGHPNLLARGVRWLRRKLYEDPARRRIRGRFIERSVRWDSLADEVGEVHTLLCHRDVEMGICSAMSLALATGARFRWLVHDDGSLTPQDVQRIQEAVPIVNVIARKTADERAAAEFGHLVKIQEYRRRQVMAIKLVDVRIWANSERIAYLDSDICFFRYPDFFLRALRGQEHGSYFNRDIQDAYVLPRKEIEARTGISPPEKINAGLWVMDRDDIHLEQIEGWLAGPAFRESLYAYTLDQTMIAMLGTASGHGIEHLPKEYDMDLVKDVSHSVCKHYVGVIRHGFELEGLATLLGSGR